jgi:hypothetical protein
LNIGGATGRAFLLCDLAVLIVELRLKNLAGPDLAPNIMSSDEALRREEKYQ